MRRVAVAAASVLLICIAAPAAQAHGDGFVSTITDVSPAVPGFTATITADGERITVTNVSPEPLIIDGYFGEPSVRLDSAGLWRNTKASLLSIDEDASIGTVANVADARQHPVWTRLGGGHSFVWHDHRAHWMSSAPPSQVQSDPHHSHLITAWTVPVQYGTRSGAIRGTLTYVPDIDGGGSHFSDYLTWGGIGLVVAGFAVVQWVVLPRRERSRNTSMKDA